jgi:catechol 2,3-dioxygenase-like lactoylglutathione lyase family enzyme
MADQNDSIRLKAVNHVTYNVKNKEIATKWWDDILGVKQIPSMVNAAHIVWLQIPSGAMVHLIENAAGASQPSHHGAFEVDEIEATQEAIRAKGVTTTDIQTRNDGQKAFFLDDPDGNRIEICTKSGFGVLV